MLFSNVLAKDTGLTAIIPDTYLVDVRERLVFYKRIANAQNNDAIKGLIKIGYYSCKATF